MTLSLDRMRPNEKYGESLKQSTVRERLGRGERSGPGGVRQEERERPEAVGMS